MLNTDKTGKVNTRISDRETDYQKQRMNRVISPERGDAFSGKTPARSYKDIMLAQNLQVGNISGLLNFHL